MIFTHVRAALRTSNAPAGSPTQRTFGCGSAALLPSLQILFASFCEYRHLLLGLVAQVGPQPAFDFFKRHSFALLVIQHLVPSDLSYSEIFCILMAEIEPTHRGAGPHRETLSQADHGILFGGKQVEKNP